MMSCNQGLSCTFYSFVLSYGLAQSYVQTRALTSGMCSFLHMHAAIIKWKLICADFKNWGALSAFIKRLLVINPFKGAVDEWSVDLCIMAMLGFYLLQTNCLLWRRSLHIRRFKTAPLWIIEFSSPGCYRLPQITDPFFKVSLWPRFS